MDKTANDRVKRQRELRIAESWQEVKVWVPTESDAEQVRALAAKLRGKAETVSGLSGQVPSISRATERRIGGAIAQLGSKAFTTESGPILELMTDLSNEDDLQGFSRAFVILARASPANAAFVAAAVPAKISNFFVKHRGIGVDQLTTWTKAHPQWVGELKDSVRNPQEFERVVEAMAKKIKA